MEFKKLLRSKKASESGQSFLEYALMTGISLIALLAVAQATGPNFIRDFRNNAVTAHFESVRSAITGD